MPWGQVENIRLSACGAGERIKTVLSSFSEDTVSLGAMEKVRLDQGLLVIVSTSPSLGHLSAVTAQARVPQGRRDLKEFYSQTLGMILQVRR